MIIFASRTGNVRHIVGKMGVTSLEITKDTAPHLIVNEPFLLFTYTDNLGGTPLIVEQFMKNNHQLCKGVFASGNTNFGLVNFAKVADNLNAQYGTPILKKVELRSFEKEIRQMADMYNEIIQKEKTLHLL